MRILQLTCHFSPNVGGVETHLDDLVKVLSRKNEVFVLAYRPLATKASWRIRERKKNVNVFRIPWLPGLFYKLVKKPVLEFLYLTPGIFIATPFVLFLYRPKVIHAHGLVAGFTGVFWGRLFEIRTVVSTHSIYHFPSAGLYYYFAKFIFGNAQAVLALSRQSAGEIERLGIPGNKIIVFTYWVDLNKFRAKSSKSRVKEKLGWRGFNVLYVGRLVEEKGILVLINSIKSWNKNVNLKIIGTGPLGGMIENYSLRFKNLEYLGKVDNEKLSEYYAASDLLIVPSVHEEGFGRVILEALACGVPIVGASRGAIPEAIDETVGKLIDVDENNIKKTVEYFYKNRDKLRELSRSARKYAERKYSERNVSTIINCYIK